MTVRSDFALRAVPPPPGRAYAVATAAVGVSFLIERASSAAFGVAPPLYLTPTAAVLAAAWYGGFGPGIAATVGAVVLESVTAGGEPFVSAGDASGLFLLAGIGMSILGALLHAAIATGRAAGRDVLEYRAELDAETGFRSAIEAAPSPMLVVDADGRIVLANAHAEQLLGYGPGELVGQLVEMLVPPGVRASHPQRRAAFLSEARARPIGVGRDLYAVRRDATQVPVEIGLSPFTTAAGVRVIVTVIDLSERRRRADEAARALEREQALRLEAEASTRTIRQLEAVTDAALATLSFENIPDELLARIHRLIAVDIAAILLLDEAGKTLTLTAARGIEAAIDEGLRIPIGRGFAGRIAAERRPLLVEDVSQIEIASRALREAGVRSLLGVPLVAEGRVVGVLHVGTVTPRRFTQEEVSLLQLVGDRIALVVEHVRLLDVERRLRADAEAANRAKDEFLAVVSHELRTPLNPIAGWTHLMRQGTLSPGELRSALDGIERNMRAVTRLIDDLLDASRMATGKVQLTSMPVALGGIVAECVESMRTAAEAKGVRLGFELEASEAVVLGDPDRLRQITANLISNAVKFTPPGGRVDVQLSRAADRIELRVADSGQGIVPSQLGTVFERFWQGDSSFARRHGGLGIGLSIVQHLVELHGGEVHAESEGKGRGATFVVALPAAPAAPRPRDPPAGTSDPDEALRGRRVLVVDDEPDSLEVVRMLLAGHGAEVQTAASVAQARVLLAGDWVPDVLVSDLAMPFEDGCVLVEELRAREAHGMRHTPAVALTAFSREEDRRRAVAAGFDAHMAKPVEGDDLLGLVAKLAAATLH